MAALSVEIHYSSNYDRNNSPLQQIAGYIARRAYTITLEKNMLDLLEKLIAAGLNNGANRLSNFESHVVNLPKAKDEALKKAVQNARAKADLIAAELGLKVGTALRVEEKDASSRRQQSFSGYGGHAPSGGSMPLGNIPISASVEIDFQLVQ